MAVAQLLAVAEGVPVSVEDAEAVPEGMPVSDAVPEPEALPDEEVDAVLEAVAEGVPE